MSSARELPVDIEVSPYAVVRAAAWPIETLDEFAAPVLADLARDVLRGADEIATARAELTDGLAALVPTFEHSADRGALLAARRTLHGSDLPLALPASIAEQVRPAHAALAEALLADDERRRHHAALVDELRRAHADAHAAELRALRRVAGSPEFLTALLIGNVDLARRWQRLLASEVRGVPMPDLPRPARVRRLEHSVYNHLCRAVGRVVPGSCWAGVAPALPARDGATGFTARAARPEVRVEPDLRAFEALVPRLGADTSIASGHPVRVDPQAVIDDDDSPGAPFTRLLIEAFGTETRSAPDVIGVLTSALGGGAEIESRLVAALQDLLDRGVVVSACVLPRGAIDAWDALDAVAPLLGASARSRWTDLTASLRVACSELADAVTAERPHDAARALDTATELVSGFRTDMGADGWPSSPVRVVVRLPFAFEWGPDAQGRAGHAVRAVLARFAADGVAEAHRRALAAPIARLVGPGAGAGDDGLSLMAWLGREPFVARGPRQLSGDDDTLIGAARRFDDPDLVTRARAAVVTWESVIRADAPLFRLPEAPPIESAVARAGPVGSLRFELGADELIFRGGRPEPGFGAHRRSEWFPDLHEELQRWFASWADDGVDAIELVGADPSNPNVALGVPVAPRRIGPVPGGVDPRRLTVHLDDDARAFLVEHDADGRVVSGRRVVPVHPYPTAIGTANPLTAGVWRIAQTQGWEWVGMGVPLLPVELAAEPAGLPCLELDDGVVVAPRRWVLDPAALRAMSAQSPVEAYLSWCRLVEQSGLPAMVLARTSVDPDTPERLVRTDSPLAIQAFLAHLAMEPSDRGRVVVRALPADSNRWPVRSAAGHHLAEIVVSWRAPEFWRASRPPVWRQVTWTVPSTPDGTGPVVPWSLVAESVAELTAAGATHVWFTRKDGVRLRARGDAAVLEPILRDRSDAGLQSGELLRATPTVYEPERARFGGAEGLALAHELFHRDSPLALRELQLDDENAPLLHRFALAVSLTTSLITESVDDGSDLLYVWQQLDTIARSAPRGSSARDASFTASELTDVVVEPDGRLARALLPLLRDGRALASSVAPRLRALAREGTLPVGMPAWLGSVTLFAWNRRDLGLHPGELATATAAAVSWTAR